MPLIVVALLLGLVQGLGEFLPISSSGHLVVAQAVFGLEEPEVAFDVVLHLGTLCAVFIFYRETLITLIKELRFLPGALISPARMKELYAGRPDFRFGLLILLGSIPTGIIGLALKDVFETYFTGTLTVGAALLVTGVLLRLVGSRGREGRSDGQMTLRDALIIGLVQGLAIVPGFSRSGFTICAGLFAGLNRVTAARYSFILSIPAILGAVILELRHGLASHNFGPAEFGLGFFAAAISGFLALSLLVKLLKQDNFAVFSWWCWAVGLFAIGWSLLA
ncbi:undecaprenyl-diphosphate phosphatase [Deltaproteobacteria bacterium OttesenSCG-928-K17]|nr:undecaprenyl-diphosphate phosphatase [Deltaproteobacteria bacterium OttesenSCG-928-K17]